MPLPDGAPEGGFWSHDDKGQLRVFLKKDGRTFMWDPDKKKAQADE
ncbi:MAG: hypothetical protein H6905_09640 [Hyphomicrobiales bacterium]|nr:hypothetical protein [Hyphomicrobiales bacterium]